MHGRDESGKQNQENADADTCAAKPRPIPALTHDYYFVQLVDVLYLSSMLIETYSAVQFTKIDAQTMSTTYRRIVRSSECAVIHSLVGPPGFEPGTNGL